MKSNFLKVSGKLVFIISVLLGTATLVNCNPNLHKISKEEVNKEILKKATDLGTRIMDAKNNNSYLDLDSGEATDAMIRGFDAKKQEQVHGYWQKKYGSFKSMEYIEAWVMEKEGLQIFRYKADFSESKKKLEVRVVLNNEGKLAGFFVNPWLDVLK